MANLRRAGDVSRFALPPPLLAGLWWGLLACWPRGGWLALGAVGRVGLGSVGRLLALVLACGLCYTPLALQEGTVPFVPQRTSFS